MIFERNLFLGHCPPFCQDMINLQAFREQCQTHIMTSQFFFLALQRKMLFFLLDADLEHRLGWNLRESTRERNFHQGKTSMKILHYSFEAPASEVILITVHFFFLWNPTLFEGITTFFFLTTNDVWIFHKSFFFLEGSWISHLTVLYHEAQLHTVLAE